MGCHSLLQGVFPTQGLNLGLLHCRQILHHLSLQGSPNPVWACVLMRLCYLLRDAPYLLQKASRAHQNGPGGQRARPGTLGTQDHGGESAWPPSGPQGPCGDAAPGSWDESEALCLSGHIFWAGSPVLPLSGQGEGTPESLVPPVDGQGLTIPWFILC